MWVIGVMNKGVKGIFPAKLHILRGMEKEIRQEICLFLLFCAFFLYMESFFVHKNLQHSDGWTILICYLCIRIIPISSMSASDGDSSFAASETSVVGFRIHLL